MIWVAFIFSGIPRRFITNCIIYNGDFGIGVSCKNERKNGFLGGFHYFRP